MKYCSICGMPENETPRFYKHTEVGDNLCNKHYIQLKRHGKTFRGLLPLGDKCSVCGDDSNRLCVCYIEGEYYGKTFCGKHISQIRNKGKITESSASVKNRIRICEVCGSCDDVIHCVETNQMLCRKHYDHILKFGKIIETTIRNNNRFNIVEDENGEIYVEIILRNNKAEEVARTSIDLEDLEKIVRYKWHSSTWGYATSQINGEFTFLQNAVLEKDGIVDHIDRNALNNRRKNLIASNKSLNSLNAGIRSNNASGITGVSFATHFSLWRAYIGWEGQRIELGLFKEIEDAIKARLTKEKELLGDLAPQKHLFEEYGIST